MNEIGLQLKEKREEGGLSVSEVAEDLKVEESDIEKAKELKNLTEVKKIASPYTDLKGNKKNVFIYGIIIFVILLFVFFASYFVVNRFFDPKNNDTNISYIVGGNAR